MVDQDETRKHLRRLSLFLAKYDPDGTERRELHIYEELVNNDVQALRSRISASSGSNENPWPWRKRKTAEEWLEFYLDYEESIDKKAEKAKQNWAAEEAEQVAGPSQPRSTPKPPSSSKKTIPSTPSRRTAFDENDDYNLMQFLAIECPEPKGRKSINTYTKLFDNLENKWPWASRHPAEAWRERYKKRDHVFDPWIEQHQKRLEIDPKDGPRPDLWDVVEQRDYVKGRRKKAAKPAKKATPQSAKQPLKPASSQNRPKKKRARKRAFESDTDTDAEDGEYAPPPQTTRGKGKQRAIPQEEEEESDEVQDDVLPVVREETEEPDEIAEDAPAEEPVPAPAQSDQQPAIAAIHEDVDEEMAEPDDEVDELDPSLSPEVKQEENEAHIPSAELVREWNELQEMRRRGAEPAADPTSTQESETQDAQETEDLLTHPETQAVEEMDDSELVEQEIDELMSDDDPLEKSPSPRNEKKVAPASPRIAVQEPTPPTSDSITSPPRSHTKSQPSQPEASSSTQPYAILLPLKQHMNRMTTVLRKRTRDDFFEDLESEAQTSTPPRPTKRRALHVIEEGKYGTTSLREVNKPGTAFTNGRRRSGVDELPSAEVVQAAGKVQKPVQWPPKWEKGKAKESTTGLLSSPVKAGERTKMAREAAREQTEEAEDLEFNPFAESSQLPETFSPKDNVIVRDASREASIAPTVIVSDDEKLVPPSPKKRPSYHDMPPPQAGPSWIADKLPVKSVFRPQFSSKGKERAIESFLPESGPSPARRHTFNEPLASSSHSSTFSSGHRTRPRYSLPTTAVRRFSSPRMPLGDVAVDGVVVSPEDHQLALAAGVDAILQQLATETGFQLDVVHQAWRRTRRFSLTEEWLHRMCGVLINSADKITREIVAEAEASGVYDDLEGDTGGGVEQRSGEGEVYHPPEHSRAWLLERSRIEEGRQDHDGSDELEEQAPPAAPVPEPQAAPTPKRVSDSHVTLAQRIRDKMRRRGS